jgi:hypothetical protein
MGHLNTEQYTNARKSTVEQPGVRCLPEALNVLRKTGVALVRFEYAGQAGYRRTKPVSFHEKSGRTIEPKFPRSTRQELEVFFRELLELRFPEWGRAEGSRGQFEWDLGKDELVHSHQWRVIVYEDVTVSGLSSCRQ